MLIPEFALTIVKFHGVSKESRGVRPMCGLIGMFDPGGLGEDAASTALAMSDRVRHRGPDADGVWVDRAAGVALGHRRLSILDLSPSGAQPMRSADGRWAIVYNGEVYNYLDIRSELQDAGVSFIGHSDTEVVLEAIALWGVDATVRRLVGIFAMAVWDRRDRRLALIRDHIGVKPLYWARSGSTILFASEPRAFRAYPGWAPSYDTDSVLSYLQFGYVAGRRTIWRDVEKIAPGTFVMFDADRSQRETTFWSVDAAVEAGERDPWVGADEEAVERLEELLLASVRGQMIADVPLGAFLSGGIDSSLVVALMQKISDRPVRTFSIGFDEGRYNEAAHAREVARHLGADHTELLLDAKAALEALPAATACFDEPFADNSQIPTHVVSSLARRHVTVSLSGDGGDELFAGYGRYRDVDQMWRMVGWAPTQVRRAAKTLALAAPEMLMDAVGSVLPKPLGRPRLGAKVRRAAATWDRSLAELYRATMSHWIPPEAVMRPGLAAPPAASAQDPRWSARDPVAQMQYADMRTYLPDDVLVKVDRASMAVGLEARVPLLDHRIVEFSWRLPRRLKLRQGVGKWALRQVLYRHVPQSLVDRPKMGFSIPINEWLRGPLRDWAASLLGPDAVARVGFLDSDAVQAAWNRQQSGDDTMQYAIWTALMFQDWAERERAESARSSG